jgi:hypothetical protein
MDVRRIESMAELRGWATWSVSQKDRNTYEIDEFVEGTLFHCDSLVQGGKIIWSNACRNINPCMQFALGRSIGAYTLPVDHDDAIAVRAFNAQALEALEPPDGAVHLECFMTPSGELVFLELGARPPGGDMVGLYKRCLGLDLDLAHFLLRAGEPFRLELSGDGSYGAWGVHPKRAGRVLAIEMPEFLSESRVKLNVAVGDTIDSGSRSLMGEAAAEFWLYNKSFALLDRDIDVLRELQLCAIAAIAA